VIFWCISVEQFDISLVLPFHLEYNNLVLQEIKNWVKRVVKA
jgi:hypothetical protein